MEARREDIRDAGLGFSERQHHKFRVAWEEGRLIQALCGAMERYEPKGDEYYLRPMAEAIKRGLPTWEHTLIQKGAPWTPYVTLKARRGAERCIQEATDYVPLL
jgi:hypothetical protein